MTLAPEHKPTRRKPPAPRSGAARPPAAAPARPAALKVSKRAAKPSPKPAPKTAAPTTTTKRPTPGGIWDSPTTSYYLITGVTVLLIALGLVMVLSASTVYSLRETGGQSTMSWFTNQAKFALLAIPGAVAVAYLPLRVLKVLAWPAMLGSLGLLGLGLMPQFRVEAGGNEAWIYIAGQSLQPGEFAKLGLALWLGLVLGSKQDKLDKLRHLIFPAGVGIALVIAGVLHTKDFGTALIFFILVGGALWIAGVPLIMFLVAAMGAAGLGAFFVMSSDNRLARVAQFLGKGTPDPLGLDFQPTRALQGLGTGGWSGVGLGSSRVKWLYLPEAHNDYIFAIIGEELGLAGSLVVLGLFLALAYGMLRVIRRHPDPFVKIATAGIGAWIIGQALVNIAVTLKLFPVLGVPLPLISAGGSSLISTILALGFVIGFARTEPGCREALQSRNFRFRPSVAVLAPRQSRGK